MPTVSSFGPCCQVQLLIVVRKFKYNIHMLGENEEEVLLSYGLYIQPNTLKDLHSEALSRTQHMKIRSEEMNNFFVGYRQLSEEELDLYDKNNRPSIPYPFTYQINNTATVSVGMPSCLYLDSKGNEWQTDGCRVRLFSKLT